jgi:nucleotide-binding universal stress UspA family protein
MFTRVLVPLDGCRDSTIVLPLARVIALATGASTTLLRVLPEPDVALAAEPSLGLKRLREELTGSGIRIETIVRYGQPADEILNYIGTRGADLIIMPRHAGGNLEGGVLGSVAQSVLCGSSVPALLVGPGSRRICQLRTLLVFVDRSKGGAVALAAAVELAQASGACLNILEVVAPTRTPALAGRVDLPLSARNRERGDLAGAREQVRGLVERVRTTGLTAEGDARIAPDVAATIVDVAGQTSADLIMMSTHAPAGSRRWSLPSVAEGVVRRADRPVVLVRSYAVAEETPSRARDAAQDAHLDR